MNGPDLLKQCTTMALLEGKRRGVAPRQVTRHDRSDLVPDIRCSFPVSFTRDLYETYASFVFFFHDEKRILKMYYIVRYYVVTEACCDFSTIISDTVI